VGIAEANMVSTGAGFSKIRIYSRSSIRFGQFGITKGNFAFDDGGAFASACRRALFACWFSGCRRWRVSSGDDLFCSHIVDTSYGVIAPSCSDEAEALMYQALKKFADDRSNGRDGETYIFFVGRENYPLYWTENAKYPGEGASLARRNRRRPDRMRSSPQ